MLASRLHWRLLIGTIIVLMAAMLFAPRIVRGPDLDENRVLAQRPALPASVSELGAFRKAADTWVSDRFPARPHLIGALNRVRMLAGVSGSPRVVVGREGWLFYDGGDHLASAQAAGPTDPQALPWLLNLAGRTEALKAKGVTYLVLAPPLQETVYPEFAPGWLRLHPERQAVRLAELARRTGAGEVLYLHPILMAAKARGAPMYTRHDTHWTGQGAWEGYAAMMRRLKALGAAVDDPRPMSDFREIRPGHVVKPRNLALMLGVASFVDVDYLELGDPEAEAHATTTWLHPLYDWTKPHVIDTGAVGKPVLMLTRDSFSTALTPYLYRHFSRIILSHTQDGTWREDLMAAYRPDIVVLEVLESGLGYSLDPAPAPSEATRRRILERMAPRPPLLAPTAQRLAAALDAAPAGKCNLERVEMRAGRDGPELLVSGWISELAAENTAPLGWVRLRGPALDVTAPVRVDVSRPDVAAYFKAPKAAEASGFAGLYRLPAAPAESLAVYRRAGAGWIACDGGRLKPGG